MGIFYDGRDVWGTWHPDPAILWRNERQWGSTIARNRQLTDSFSRACPKGIRHEFTAHILETSIHIEFAGRVCWVYSCLLLLLQLSFLRCLSCDDIHRHWKAIRFIDWWVSWFNILAKCWPWVDIKSFKGHKSHWLMCY